MNNKLKLISIAFVCLGLAGCAPGVQSQGNAKTVKTAAGQPSGNWNSVIQAINTTANASMYKIKSDVSLKNGSMHTDYSVYGTVNMPDTMSLDVHENNFNISFYQQGKVAYADEQNNWMHTTAIDNFNAFKGYEDIAQQAQAKRIALTQLPKKFIVNEYCDVYEFTLPSAQVTLPSFVTSLAGAAKTAEQAGESVQYTMYVGQKSHLLRQVETQSVNSVNELGPVATSTTTTFFDINKPNIATVTIPKTLVRQLEGSVK